MIPADIPDVCRPLNPDAVASAPRIFVVGCARSGTTLLLHLFRAFADVVVLDREHCATDLVEHPDPRPVVAKRTPHCATHLAAPRSVPPELWIIDVTRDPRDVITSRLPPYPGFYCGFDRWVRDITVSRALHARHERFLVVRYETLVADPDRVQHRLAGPLGLTIAHPFSSWPTFAPPELSEQATTALGGTRALTATAVGRWRRTTATRRRVAEQLATHPGVEDVIRAAGYPPTDLTAPTEGW